MKRFTVIIILIMSGLILSGILIFEDRKPTTQNITVIMNEFTMSPTETEEDEDDIPEFTWPMTEIDYSDEALKFYRNNLPTRKYSYIGVTKPKTKIKISVWKGGSVVNTKKFKQTIEHVLHTLPHIKVDKRIVVLLMETAAIESNCGYYMTQRGGGEARGIFQMNISTYDDTLDWLKKYKTKAYVAVTKFYRKKNSKEWNYRYNIPFQIAMAASYYWRYIGSDLNDHLGTVVERAMMYKLVWNTKHGATTPAKYLNDIDTYL